MANYVASTKSPNLVVAPIQYSAQHGDILNNQLRLYFNQLDLANAQTIQAINNLNVMSWLNTGSM